MTNPPSSDEEFSVKVGADGMSVSSKGDAAARLSHALADALSPLSNSIGWLGDQISIKRQMAALRAATKARAQLADEGITEANIPPRILLPWLEGASLNDGDTNDPLTEAWAGLLVRAAKSSDAAVASYIETLKRIGKEEAELLQFFATDTSPDYGQKFYTPGEFDELFSKNAQLDTAFALFESALQERDIDKLREYFDSFGIQAMRQIIFFSTPFAQMISTPYFDKHEHAVSNLEHLGLIRIYSNPLILRSGNIEIVWLAITKFAFDLIWACEGKKTSAGSFTNERLERIRKKNNA